jgi:hypothetical protein
MSAMAKAKALSAATETTGQAAEKLSDKARLERALKMLKRIVEEGQGQGLQEKS